MVAHDGEGIDGSSPRHGDGASGRHASRSPCGRAGQVSQRAREFDEKNQAWFWETICRSSLAGGTRGGLFFEAGGVALR